MEYYYPLIVAVILFLIVTRIFFPELFTSKRHVYDQDWLNKTHPDKRYPTDEQISTAYICYAPNKFSNIEPYHKAMALPPDEKRELMALMYMIGKAIDNKETSVSPGIEPPYEAQMVSLLKEFGFEVEYQGFTYLISW